MEPIIVDAMLQEKTSKKGNPYFVVTVSLTDKVTKDVLLERSEVELIKLVYGTK